MNFRSACLLIVGVVALLQTSGAKPQNQTPIELKPCEVRNITGPAKCGTYEVFENRATRKGRKININVLVLPATGEQREPDPLFYLAGGPGSAATEDAPGIARALAKIRQHRDLVFVDQRGTGQSYPLDCKFYDPKNPQSYFGYFFPLDEVRQCRRERRGCPWRHVRTCGLGAARG